MRFSARRNCPRERWGRRRLIGKAFHRRGPATPNARSPRHERVRGTKHVTGRRRQMTVVDGDRQRQRVDSHPSRGLPMQRFELARPAWTELVGGLEASAAAGEQAICGRAVERDQTCSGVLDRLKPLHQSISNTIHETVAVVQACWHERLDTHLRSVDGQWTYNWPQLT